VAETVATPVVPDTHADEFVTVCVVPSLIVAVACNWLVCPAWIDVFPVTESDTTVGGAPADTTMPPLPDWPS
jgi:hypothetical protein